MIMCIFVNAKAVFSNPPQSPFKKRGEIMVLPFAELQLAVKYLKLRLKSAGFDVFFEHQQT
jgi:hypothetical protein